MRTTVAVAPKGAMRAGTAGPRTGARHAVSFVLLVLSASVAHAQLAVSDGGTPAYSQAIAVPPGVAGMSPKIGLFYAGGGVNGPVGHGWSVQGISSVTRCAAIRATDGIKGSVRYAASDKLCLDGQRLIQTDEGGNPAAVQNANGVPVATQVNDSAGLSTGYREFRTEKDTYARVRSYGYANGDTTGASGPAYFKVWTKSGQIYEYGAGPSSDANTQALINAKPVINGQTVTVPMVWAVARVSDTLGNYIDFKYEQRDVAWGSGPTAGSPALGHEWNVSEIQYSGNKVIFSYADRTPSSTAPQDSAEAYHLGSKNVSVRLLQSITTYVKEAGNMGSLGAGSGVPVKTTVIGYDRGPISGRSRVTTLKECAGDAASTRCLPATTFTYAAGGNDAYQANAAFASGSLATLTMQSTAGTYGVLVGDFDGDGKTDFIRWADDPTQNQLYLSNGDGTFRQVPAGTGAGKFNITDENIYKSDGCYYSLVADFNGDGLPDILRYSAPTNSAGVTCATYGAVYIYLNNGDGSFNRVALTGPTLQRTLSAAVSCGTPAHCQQFETHPGWTAGANFFFLDADGDGKLDIVTTVLPAYGIYADFNVDPCLSQTCTQVWHGNGDGSFTSIPTNLTNISVYVPPNAKSGPGSPRNVADYDGDGLADLVSISTQYFNHSSTYRSNGDGTFTAGLYAGFCDQPVDFNGDGRADCLGAGLDGTANGNYLNASVGSSYVIVGGFNLRTTGQELGVGFGVLPVTVGFVIADVNGDGRSDIIRWRDDATQNALYVSNGDGTFSTSTTFNFSGIQLKKSDLTSDFISADFSGRGTPEILRMKASPTPGASTSNQLYVKADPTPPDQLLAVTTGTGATTTLYYVPLSNSTPSNGVSGSYARYAGDRGTSNASTGNTVDVNFPLYVVATSKSDGGVANKTVNAEYSYFGLKADTAGRGLLGFREVKRQTPSPNGAPLTVDTQYLSAQPYIGVASRTDTFNSALTATSTANLLSSTLNTYCDQTVAAGVHDAALASAKTAALASPPQPGTSCATAAKVQRPYLLWSTETGKDLSGVTLPSVTTENAFNGAGDPLTVKVDTAGSVAGISQTFNKTTTNQYLPDNTAGENWVLGRLSRASVQSTVPNSLSSIITNAGNGAYATATSGTGPTQTAVITPSLSFGNVNVGASSTLPATLANDGAAALSITVPSAASVSGADYSFVSTTCPSSIAPGSNCTVSVKFAPSAPVARSGTLSVVTGAATLNSALSGTGVGSSVTTTADNASALSATKGGANATGTVTFTNSGNQAATLAMSGLSGVYSVAPASCTAAASGGTCVVTVTMTTGGVIGAQGAQTLTATGGTTGAATAAVSGTLNGSSVTTTADNASALSATKGGTNATGTVTFTNGGNQAATLTMSGLSGVYSVAPVSCTAAASGGTCVVTVTMTTGGAIGAQGAQTLTATGGTTGTATAAVSGTLNGSSVTTTTNNASALSATKGGANATGTVTFTNSGNQAATLTMSGLSGVYSVAPASCTAVAGGGTCVVTVTMTTGGTIGAQGAQTLTATGGTTGVATAAVSGTLNGSSITTTADNAAALSATKGGANATGTVTFTNGGNQAATLTMSGLSGVYSVAPTSCTAAAGGGTCVVTVTMTTGGAIGPQGAQTLTATGGTTGAATAAVSGTLNGSSVTTTVDNASALSATYGGAAATGTVTFTNSGNQAATLTMSGLSGVYSVAPASCTAAAGGGTCVVTVTMTTGGTIGAQGAQTLTATGGTTGVATAAVSGTLNGSSITTTADNAAALSATYGGAAATGTVTFTNSGNQAATLTMSGLSGVYSVAPTSCTAAAGGGTCVVTVTMTTGGAIGPQGAQTLTATGGTTGAATAAVSGTLNGSSVTTTVDNASALSATYGGAAATGTVTFTNSGNQAATLTMSGLSGVYSVAPTSCTAAAGGGTCVVTVTMTTGGTIGAQGAQTLTATGGTTGVATAAVSGTLNGSSITTTADNAAALSATKGGANATGTVTFTNGGNQAATLTMSGLSGVYSVGPTSCTAAAGGGTCVVTVTMTTGGAIGAQGAQTLTATGGTTGAATAAVSGTLNGSSVTTTANGASALSAAQGAAAATGTVTFTNSGNVAATLTMSGLTAPYSVSPTSCSIAATGGTCSVTVSMTTAGAIGAQGAQTLTATGGTTGTAIAAIAGTVTGSIATMTSAAPNLGTVYVGAASPSANVTFRNDGNTALTVSGLAGNSPAFFPVNANSCSGIAPAASCTMTIGMVTSAPGSGPIPVTTIGANGNASFSINGSVSSSVSSWSTTSLAFGNVAVGAHSTQNITLSNTGYGPLSGIWNGALNNLPAAFAANTSACSSVPVGGNCSVGITFSPTAAQAYSGGSIYPSNVTSYANLLSVSGTGVAATTTLTSSPTTLAFGTVAKDFFKDLTVTITNTGSQTATGLAFAYAYTSGSGLNGAYSSVGGTCTANGSIAAGGSCTVVVEYTASCTGGGRNGTLTTSGANFPALVTTLTATTSSSGTCN